LTAAGRLLLAGALVFVHQAGTGGGVSTAWGQPSRTTARRPSRKRKPRRPPASRPAVPPQTSPATKPKPEPPAAPDVAWPAEPLSVRVDRAVRRGLDYLYGIQKPDGSWDTKYVRQHAGGVEALVLLAALTAGEDPAGPKLAAALKYINELTPRTIYVRAVRAMVYARLPAGQYADRLAEDVDFLAHNQGHTGGWGYGPGHRTTRENPAWTDISNTFLAMLALRDAELAGAKVPGNVWSRCRIYFSRAANADGGMGYQPPGGMGFRLRGSSYGSMTAAGAAALLILSDKWAAANEPPFTNTGPRRINPSPYSGPVHRALKWLAANYTLKENPKWVWVAGEAYEYYYLYVLQHLADAGGLEKIGPEAIVDAAAEVAVARQKDDGSWGDPQKAAAGADGLVVIRTCFALLCLLRARGPIVIHKLALGDFADSDPRDAANLAGWIGQSFKWQASWRRVTPQTPGEGLARAPLLYIQSSLKEYPQSLDARIRSFLAQGGTVVAQPFTGEKDLVEAADAYFRRLFPDYVHGLVPDSHPVYSAHFKVPLAGRPRMLGFSDGCRTRIFLLASDVSGAWHQGLIDTHPHLFQLGANLLLYTTDLAAPKGKLLAAAPRPAPPAPARTIKLARVKHGGDWDVCPQALGRLGDVLAEALSLGVTEAQAVDLSKPVDAPVSLLWLTGTRAPNMLASQRTHLKNYLAAGGMLFVDSAMGSKEFSEAAAAMLAEMFPAGSLQDLPADHPLVTGEFAGGMGGDLTQVRYTRAAAAETPADKPVKLTAVTIDGRIAVVLSRYSVICPLLAQPTYGCKGLATPDAARLAANVVLYAATR